MTTQEIERRLDNYYSHADIADLTAYIDGLMAAKTALYDTRGSMGYDGMPHNPMPGDPTLSATMRIGDKPERLQEQISDAKNQVLVVAQINKKIATALSLMPADEAQIVRYRHAVRPKLQHKEIAAKMGTTERTVQEKYHDALEILAEEMEE